MEALRGAAPQSNDAGEVPIVTNSHFHGLEDRWRRTLLIAIPFGALAFFLGMALEGPSNQVSAYDQYTYPVMGFALVALELTLLFFPRRLRFVVLAIVAGSSAFFLGKLIYLLFLFPANQGVLRQMTETFYWIPIIYLLSFLIPNVTGGRATAMSFTVLVLVVSAGYIGAHLVPLHWTHPGDEHWGVVYALAELNLANSVMLALTFAFIGFKERYTRARTEMETMDRVANTDLLTELPNRRRLNRELEKALVRADESNSQLAVLFVDLDRFKTINDTLGHEAGDELLRQVGVRLRATVRDDDLVARLSGDEFVVVVQHVSGRDQVTLLAERLLTALSKPFRVKEIELQVTASIGMAIFPWDARDARALIRHADSAMYKVKRTGKNGIRHYHKESDAEIERRSELERDMGRALKEDQLRLHYQPIYDLNSGELVMVEALLRWEHPEHGMISPGEFVPLAEQSGQIIAIGSWVLTEACRQVASWHRHQLGDFRLSVNVSLLQFSQAGFYDTIRQALHDSGGTAVAVPDEEILTAMREMSAAEGLLPSPESAATWAATKRLVREGWIQADERVVLFSCGTLLKHVDLLPHEALPVLAPEQKAVLRPGPRRARGIAVAGRRSGLRSATGQGIPRRRATPLHRRAGVRSAPRRRPASIPVGAAGARPTEDAVAAVDVVLVGCGLRGRGVYGGFALRNPDRMRVVALAEPDPVRRQRTGDEHRIPESLRFAHWSELFAGPRRAPAAIIATPDREHVQPALRALEAGYHVLLEKPIAPDPAGCLLVVEAAERAGRILQVGHVLRFAPFYERVFELVQEGAVGELLHIELSERVAAWHYTHSFVRGKFRNRELAAPFVVAKCCHDLDLLVWLAGRGPERVASFGGLGHFAAASAPPGAPARCTDGCPASPVCPHDAVAFYLGPGDALGGVWPWSDLGPDPAREARRRALETGPYGRCVYRCDNDQPDHQVVAVRFAGGLTGSFSVQGAAPEEERTVRVVGSRGELVGGLAAGSLELRRPGSLEVHREELPGSPIGHFGGDEGLCRHFCESVGRGLADDDRASGRVALEGHLLGYAAERARAEGQVVPLAAFRAGLGSAPAARR